MKNIEWNAPYLDRKAWILENLENLNVDVKEALVLLLIDYFNSCGVNINHELIASKLKITEDDVEEIFTDLTDKGYLDLPYEDGRFAFDISGVFDLESIKDVTVSRSIIEEFEEEFKRTLSGAEMNRILELSNMYDERMVSVALTHAAAYNKRSINYIEQILISWKEKGLTVEDVENGMR